MTVAILAAILNVDHLVRVSGYPLLFVLVMGESSGVPIPGETALIAAAVLASQETLTIEIVIALAAAAAIVGDNIGYLIGRKGGRWLLERPGAFHYQRSQVLATGQPFFERHGPKAVFFGRFILGLRVWASWLAGATHMRWRSFLVWNALGGITWAVIVGTIAYLLGSSASGVLKAFGVYGLVAVLVAGGGFLVWHRRQRRHGSLAARHGASEPARSAGPAESHLQPDSPTAGDRLESAHRRRGAGCP
jgi:membrane-associated protein